jgi:hypothetical protein
VSGRREDLFRREAEGWGRLEAVLYGLNPERLERRGSWDGEDLSLEPG